MAKGRSQVNQEQSVKYQNIAKEALDWADTMLSKRQDELSIGDSTGTYGELTENRWDQALNDATFKKDPAKAAAARRDGRTYMKVPYIYSYIRGKTADEVETMPFPRAIGNTYRDFDTAYMFQKLFDYVTEDVLQLKRMMAELNLKQKNVYGDGFIKFDFVNQFQTYKKYKLHKKTKVVLLDKDGDPRFEEYKVNTYKDVKAEILPIENLVIDPMLYQVGRGMRNAKRAGIFSYYLKEDFDAAFKGREGFFNIENIKGGGTMNIVPSSISAERTKVNKDFIEVYESWDLLKDEHVYIADGTVIYYDACPYWNPYSKEKYLPIAHFVDNVSPSGVYNWGEPHILHDIIEEKMTQKVVNLDLGKRTGSMIFIDDMGDVDVDAIKWRHGGFVKANNPAQTVQSVSLSANSQLPFQNSGSLQDDETIVTGHDVTGIVGGASGESATKTLERKEASMKITRFMNSYNELGGFRDMYQIIKNMILQFYTVEDFKNIAGEEGIALYKEAKANAQVLKQDYSLKIVANNQIPATREIRKMRNTEALGILSQIQLNEQGQIPEHLKPMVRQVLLDADQPEDVVEAAVGQEPPEMAGQGGGEEEAMLAQQLESMGMDPSQFMEGGGGGGAPREVPGRSGTPKNAASGSAASEIQKTVQNMVN